MMIPGPLSFQLMIFSMGAFVVALVLGPVFGVMGALGGVGGMLLSVAAVTCGVYELKNNPQQKLYSMLGVSLSSSVLVFFLIFMIAVFSNLRLDKSSESDSGYQTTKYD